MTWNHNKPALNFRSRRQTEEYIISTRKLDFNFQNDLKSQQAAVEFQIPKAYRKIYNFYIKFRLKFPEWLYIATSQHWLSDAEGKAENTGFLQDKHISISRMTWNRKQPPLNVRSWRHTGWSEEYGNSERKPNFNFQNDLKSQQATVELQVRKAYNRIHKFKGKSSLFFQNDFKSQQATVEFHILKAYQKKYNAWKKIRFQLPEWSDFFGQVVLLTGSAGYSLAGWLWPVEDSSAAAPRQPWLAAPLMFGGWVARCGGGLQLGGGRHPAVLGSLPLLLH